MPQHPLNLPIGVAPGSAITTNTGTQVKTGPGVLLGLSVLTAGTAWTVDIYDGTSASGSHLFHVTADTVGPVTFAPTRFVSGLFVVTAGTTPGSVRPLNF